MKKGEFHPELRAYYIQNPASKSYVPKKFWQKVKGDIELLSRVHKAPKRHRGNGAHLDCDYSAVYSNEAHCADDVTLPVYFYLRSETGEVKTTRGQCLIQIDMRSFRVLGFLLQPEKYYTSFGVHGLYTRTWAETGIPKIVVHEGGIWDKSRLLKGKQHPDSLPGEEIEIGLREFGVRFIHAREARRKTVERVMGQLQDRMGGEPGYCGRNEIIDPHERFQALKRDIEAGREKPEGKLYSFDQWQRRLQEIIEDYNADPQEGKILQGLSPDEAFEKYQNPNDPPIRLDERCRYLLASSRRAVKVTRNGIKISIGKSHFNYHNEATGRLQNEKVLAWFTPEAPEILTVTTLDRKNPVCVPLAQPLHPFDAPKEQLEEELKKSRRAPRLRPRPVCGAEDAIQTLLPPKHR
jgi:hypothetical protein